MSNRRNFQEPSRPVMLPWHGGCSFREGSTSLDDGLLRRPTVGGNKGPEDSRKHRRRRRCRWSLRRWSGLVVFLGFSRYGTDLQEALCSSFLGIWPVGTTGSNPYPEDCSVADEFMLESGVKYSRTFNSVRQWTDLAGNVKQLMDMTGMLANQSIGRNVQQEMRLLVTVVTEFITRKGRS